MNQETGARRAGCGRHEHGSGPAGGLGRTAAATGNDGTKPIQGWPPVIRDRGGTKPIRLPAGGETGSAGEGDRRRRNEANGARMAERSQLEFRNGVPAGMFHHLQCSAGPTETHRKLLILFTKVVVTEKGFARFRGAFGRGAGKSRPPGISFAASRSAPGPWTPAREVRS